MLVTTVVNLIVPDEGPAAGVAAVNADFMPAKQEY